MHYPAQIYIDSKLMKTAHGFMFSYIDLYLCLKNWMFMQVYVNEINFNSYLVVSSMIIVFQIDNIGKFIT